MSSVSPISILISDEQRLVAETVAFRANHEPGLESRVHSWVRNDVLDACLLDKPDVLVMDLSERSPSAFEMPRLLEAQGIATRVLLLCGSFTDALIQLAIDSGIPGLVSKHQPFTVLRKAIRQVHRGLGFRCPEVAARLVDGVKGAAVKRMEKTKLSLLTEREREMLSLLARGTPIHEIAGDVHVSPRTIESHKFQIMKKLDLHNRIELARFAFREGLATP